MTTSVESPRFVHAAAPTTIAQQWESHGEAITTVLCAVFVLAGWLASRAGAGVMAADGLLLVGYVLGGYRQAIEGVTTLVKEHDLDVDLLMVVAAIGAAIIGYWFDGAVLIFIFALSGTLEGYASARTKRDIEALMALHPEEALVVRDGREMRSASKTRPFCTPCRSICSPGCHFETRAARCPRNADQ
ncbi:MAG: hypothetical protein ABI183_10955 [Polyangiaceae bacterium]